MSPKGVKGLRTMSLQKAQKLEIKSAGLSPQVFPCSSEIQLTCVTLVAPVPTLLPEGDGLMYTFPIEEAVVHVNVFFPETSLILVVRNRSALRSHGECKYYHPIV